MGWGIGISLLVLLGEVQASRAMFATSSKVLRCRAPVTAHGTCSVNGEEGGSSILLPCTAATYSSIGLMKNGGLLHSSSIADAPVVSLPGKLKHGCMAGRHESEEEGPFALMVDRGVCPFATKARVAQSRHASLLIIVDRSANGTAEEGMMTSPSFETDDEALVPSVLIRAVDSETLGGARRISANISITDDELVKGFITHGLKQLGNGAKKEQQKEGLHCFLAAVEAARAAGSSNADPYHHLANYYHKKKRVAEAYAYFREALAVDPDHLPAMTNLPTLLYKYDVPGLSHADKEALFQYCRCQAQVLVARDLPAGPSSTWVGPREIVRDWQGQPDQVDMVRLLPAGPMADRGEYGYDRPFVSDEAHLADFPLNPGDDPRWRHLRYVEKHIYAAQFRNVSVLGDPAVVVTDRAIFVPSPGCFVPLHSLLDAPMPPPRHYASAVLVVQMGGGSNYFHWTSECLSRLILTLDHLLRLSDGDDDEALPPGTRLILPGPARSYVEEALEELSYAQGGVYSELLDDLVVEYYDPQQRAFRADRLLTIDWRQQDDDHRPGLELATPRAALRRVREVLAPASSPTQSTTRLIVWVSRNSDRLSGHRSRTISNEEAVLSAVRGFVGKAAAGWGLRVFRGDEMNLRDTIDLFESATIVIGVHGAGLINMVYSPERTHVVEIAMATPRHRDYMHASVALGHKYWIIPAPRQALEAEITVKVEEIVGVLQEIEDSMHEEKQ